MAIRKEQESSRSQEQEESSVVPQEQIEVDSEKFFYDGHEYGVHSSLKILKDLCRESEREADDSLTMSRRQYDNQVAPLMRPRHKKPEQEEVDLHNLTHLPFAPWCEHCVATRAKENAHKKSELVRDPTEEPSKSTVAFDFAYTATSTSEAPSLVTLVACDSWSKTFCTVPVERRGGAGSLRQMAEALVAMTTQLGYSEVNLKGDNEGVCQALKQAVQRMRGSLGLATTLVESVPFDHESNGLAERAVQTARRHCNTLMDELRSKTGLTLSHDHPMMSWAMRHSSWLLNRFHRSSATGRTPYEIMTGAPYRGELVPFGSTIMVKRLRPKRKGDRLWTSGVFIGKTESGMWLTYQKDGIHAARSARPVGETYDPKAIENVKIFSWQVKPTTLASRVLPQKLGDKPTLALPSIAVGEERKQLENEVQDEAASDPTSDAEDDKDWEKVLEQETDELIAELAEGNEEELGEQQQQEQEDVEVEAGTTEPSSAAAGRSQRPEFEDVGSPCKIPRTRPTPPRFGPGTPSVLRAELRPDNDVHSEDEQWFADEEFCGDSEEESDWEEEDVEEKSYRSKKVFILPSAFFNEEAGPPAVEEQELDELDEEAAEKEVSRLTRMNVIEEVDANEDDGEDHIWLTTKLVYDWRFREAENVVPQEEASRMPSIENENLKPRRCWQRRARLVAREYNTSKRDDIFSPATSPALTKIIPILALLNHWSIWSLDIKDAFLQVPQRRPVKCRIPRGKGSSAVAGMEKKAWKLRKVLPGQRDASLLWSEYCATLLQEEGYEKSSANPALFRLIKNDTVVSVCIVHVDDLQVAGKYRDVAPILKNLSKKVKLQVEGPFLTDEDYRSGYSKSSVRFLKRKYSFEDGRLFVRPDSKYVTKLLENLGLEKRKEKNTPSPSNVAEVDNSPELNEEEASVYRSCVGILLYVGQDRPDVQFAVRSLATAMKTPTKKKYKELEHCALYLKKTNNYSLCYSPGVIGKSVLNSSKKDGGDYPEDQEQE